MDSLKSNQWKSQAELSLLSPPFLYCNPGRTVLIALLLYKTGCLIPWGVCAALQGGSSPLPWAKALKTPPVAELGNVAVPKSRLICTLGLKLKKQTVKRADSHETFARRAAETTLGLGISRFGRRMRRAAGRAAIGTETIATEPLGRDAGTLLKRF